MTNGNIKGKHFEREIARDWVKIGFSEARRQLEYHVKDALGVDLQGTGPFAVQCKRGRKYASITAIEEIYHDDRNAFCDGQIPVLITRADNKPTMAVIPWEDLKNLIRGH